MPPSTGATTCWGRQPASSSPSWPSSRAAGRSTPLRPSGEGLDVVGGLAGLVDHSLVRIGGAEADPRFGMLETIREYAAAKLDASGAREDLEERHARFYVSLAESAEPELRGNPGPWLARLETDHDNFRAALDRRAGIDGGPDIGARLAGALWRFWYLAGHLSEGRTRLEHAAAAHPEQDATRVKVLIGAAVMAVNTLDPATAAGRAGGGARAGAGARRRCEHGLRAVHAGERGHEPGRRHGRAARLRGEPRRIPGARRRALRASCRAGSRAGAP